jgi:hypothetical protein
MCNRRNIHNGFQIDACALNAADRLLAPGPEAFDTYMHRFHPERQDRF